MITLGYNLIYINMRLLAISIILFCFSCQDPTPSFINIETPCTNGGQSNLIITDNGQTYLSWIEYEDDTMVSLLLSELVNDQWSAPLTIASGSNWFVNWADFPSVVSYPGGNGLLAAHWLQKNGEGTFDYEIRISQSSDGGKSWSESFPLHKDGVIAEHGFVSLLPLTGNRIFATWLDGRNSVTSDHSHLDNNDHGSMSLRVAEFDISGNLYNEVEIDDRVCECCQTSAANTTDGLVVVYRNRSDDEIRDIYIARQVDGIWQEPNSVFNDNWRIPGCPVNGPVVRAEGNEVAVVWFTMAEDKPQVNLAISDDGGANFGLPIRIDDGDPLGRVDLLFASRGALLVSWVEQVEGSGQIRTAFVDKVTGLKKKFTIVNTDASRSSGFPRMEKHKDGGIFTWTQVDSLAKVRSGVLSI